MSLCENCIKGVTHEGTPAGKWETIGGVRAYVGTPTGDYRKDYVLLFLSDAFGVDLINNQLLVDDFSRNGFKTVMPDYLNGDSVPADVFDPGYKGTFDVYAWVRNHQREHTRPTLDKVINALKDQGTSKFGAVGYCFAGRYIFDLACENRIIVATISHPGPLEIPADFEKYASSSKAPLLINSCTFDDFFPPEMSAQADKILGGGNFAPGYKREYWEGCTHGFAVRGDLSDPKVKAGKEGAFKSCVDWLKAYFN